MRERPFRASFVAGVAWPAKGSRPRLCSRLRAKGKGIRDVWDDDQEIDFDDLEYDTGLLLLVNEQISEISDAVDRAAAARRPFRSPTLVAQGAERHWLELQVCYDFGIWQFTERSVLNIMDHNKYLPEDISWRVGGVHPKTARKVTSRVHNLNRVQGVRGLEVLESLNDAVGRNKRYQDSGLRCGVSLAATGLEDASVVEAAHYVTSRCPGLYLAGVDLAEEALDDPLDPASCESFRARIAEAADLRSPRDLECTVEVADEEGVFAMWGLALTGESTICALLDTGGDGDDDNMDDDFDFD